MKYAVMGPPVNRAARIQDLTKEVGRQILIEESALPAARRTQRIRTRYKTGPDDFLMQFQGVYTLRGVDGKVPLFALI
jgi:class 3 adenylate cyclase